MSASPIRRGAVKLPSRITAYGKPGSCKTTFGAFAPKPIFSMTRSETGLMTLLENNLVPETVDYFPVSDTWEGLLSNIEYLRKNKTDHKTYVIDVVNGAERLCHEHVCKTNPKFGGNWSSFLDFGRGFGVSSPLWADFFTQLDLLRIERFMGIILLAHSKVKRINNPDGDDYDKHIPDITEAGWQPLMRWSDMILFLHHERTVVKDGSKRKTALSGRKIYTCDAAAFDAKNRIGLPSEIEIPDGDPAQTFLAFQNAVKATRAARAANAAATAEPTIPPSTENEPQTLQEAMTAQEEKAKLLETSNA